MISLKNAGAPFLAESVDYRVPHVVTARGCFASTVWGYPTCSDAEGKVDAAQYEKHYAPVGTWTFPLARVNHVRDLPES